MRYIYNIPQDHLAEVRKIINKKDEMDALFVQQLAYTRREIKIKA